MRNESFVDEPQRWLKPSYRTISEQILGFVIFFALSVFSSVFHMWIVKTGLKSPWYQLLNKAPWIIDSWAEHFFWPIFYFIPSVTTWLIWRRISFFKIKLETSLYLGVLGFQLLWVFSFFWLKLPLLSLFALLFNLICLTLQGLVLQKNEPKTKLLLILSLGWVFYMTGINMTFCVINP